MRAGAYGLSVLANQLNSGVILALEDGPLSPTELRRVLGAPPQTTLRLRLRTLAEIGVVERRRLPGFPGGMVCELTTSGRELASAAKILAAWLASCPAGPLPIGDPAAKSAVKALIEGWSTNLVRALAAKALSLTELDRLIPGVNYPALERRLAAMRFTGQIVTDDRREGGTPYRAARWLREAVGPLLAAAHWELRQAPESAEHLMRLDVEAALLLAIPLMELPSHLEGGCRLVIDVAGPGRSTESIGMVVTVKRGRAISCKSGQRAEASARAAGPAASWLSMPMDSGVKGIRLSGDKELAGAILYGLRRTLQLRNAVKHPIPAPT